jgi:hypothetical protein
MPDALNSILVQAGAALAPLRAIDSPAKAVAFFRQLGYEMPPGSFGGALADVANQGSELVNAIKELPSASGDAAVIASVAKTTLRLTATIKSITDLHSQVQAGGAAGLPNIGQLAERLTDFLMLETLSRVSPGTHAALHVLGLVDYSPQPAAGQPMRKVRWERFGTLLSDPRQLFNDVYKWETDFDTTVFLTRFHALMRAAALPGGIYEQPDTTKTLLGNSTDDFKELRFPIIHKGVTPETYAQFGVTLSPVDEQGPKKKGVALLPYLMGTASFDFEVCEKGKLEFKSTADIAGVGMILRPPMNAEGVMNLAGAFKAAIDLKQNPAFAPELVLIGSANATRLAIQGLGMTTFIQSASKLDIGWEGHIQALKLVVKGGDGDGFIQKILSAVNIEAESQLTFGFSLLGGFYFHGGAKLALDFPIHIELGPLGITGLRIEVQPVTDHLTLRAGAHLKLELGPLKAVVENIGINADIFFRQGNLGPADLKVGFKPPNGVGLSIDAAIIKGGGYLYFDFDNEEYAGVMELSIASIVTVKAIALITTRMPDGSKNFSLLIIISVEFGTGIQLGFGFTLIGVGGLLGLNRAMMLEPIGAGIRTGAINSIAFPQDPVANAPRIISDLKTYFPPYDGKFLIGPMVKIGWGTPTLISLTVGVIIEIPGNIAIVGVISLVLPDRDAPILSINVAFIGALEFDKKRIWFFAALFDSRILFMTLEGEMGLLMDYSDNPNFVLSVGGFHPQFNPPPLPFPSPRRIRIDILRNAIARISVDCYFAVTSNTVQFGCSADLFYGIDAFNISGNFTFDALFQFSPFKFVIEMSFSIGITVFGAGVFSIRLRLKLSGPAPWNANGTGTLSIDLWLFSIDISADFDITWGEAENPKLEPVKAVPLLQTEFNKADNWKASLPQNVNLLVSLRKLDQTIEKLVLHPVGTLQISQRAMPLNTGVDKVGNREVIDGKKFTVRVTITTLSSTSYVPQEKFAIAQFQNMTDGEKLSRPSFQDMDSGIELGFSGRQLGFSKLVKRIVRYEVKMIDGDDKYKAMKWFGFVGSLFFHWLAGSAVSKSTLSHKKRTDRVPHKRDERMKWKQPGFVVANVASNESFSATSTFASEVQARDFMNEAIAKNPALAEEIHVIPTFESSL